MHAIYIADKVYKQIYKTEQTTFMVIENKQSQWFIYYRGGTHVIISSELHI